MIVTGEQIQGGRHVTTPGIPVTSPSALGCIVSLQIPVLKLNPSTMALGGRAFGR